jgi:hypothetical protein
MAYSYLHMVLDAIYMIEEDLKTKTKAELATGELRTRVRIRDRVKRTFSTTLNLFFTLPLLKVFQTPILLFFSPSFLLFLLLFNSLFLHHLLPLLFSFRISISNRIRQTPTPRYAGTYPLR